MPFRTLSYPFVPFPTLSYPFLAARLFPFPLFNLLFFFKERIRKDTKGIIFISYLIVSLWEGCANRCEACVKVVRRLCEKVFLEGILYVVFSKVFLEGILYVVFSGYDKGKERIGKDRIVFSERKG